MKHKKHKFEIVVSNGLKEKEGRSAENSIAEVILALNETQKTQI